MSVIHNPIIRGFNPDPSICRVGEDYYLATSSFEFTPGVPLYHSRDLANWTHVAYAFPSARHLDLSEAGTSQGIWAPTLRFIRGRFYVVVPIVTRRPWPDKFRNYLVSAPSIEGPWSEPLFVANGGIDPDLIEDEDGTVYYSQTSGVRTAPIDLETGQLRGELTTLWPGTGDCAPEAPHLYRIGDYVYAMLAEGGTGMGHCVTLARSRSVMGPYEPCPHNPVLTNRGGSGAIQSCGHADLVQTPSGDWFAVCLGVRDVNGISHLGRETFVTPVVWREGWPHFGKDKRVEAEVAIAGGAEQARSFQLRDDFTNPVAPLFWNGRLGWGEGTVQRGGGRLLLTPNGRTLDDEAPMAWLGVRQPDFDCAAEVELDGAALAPGVRAGLTVFLDPAHHYDLRVGRGAGGLRDEQEPRGASALDAETRSPGGDELVIELRLRLGLIDVIAARHCCKAGRIRLGVAATRDRFDFSYDAGAGPVAVGAGDPRFLGTTVAKGYTGTFLACFAEGAPRPALFSSFVCSNRLW